MKQKVDQVRVFISDFEDVYRKGIRWALSEIELFEVIGEATTNIDTLESILKTPADLLILNTDHNKPSGIDVARYLSHTLPDVKVILMMDEYRTEHVISAMKSGAKSCINKSINLEGLLQTINQVIREELPIGHYLLKPKVADIILREYEVSNGLTESTDRAHIRLVKSEQMILNRIRGNISLADLTAGLGISKEILIEYLDEIAEKLVKVEYYNETPEQKYIGNLISKHADDSTSQQNKEPGDRILNLTPGRIESNRPGDLPLKNRAWFEVDEREDIHTIQQSAKLEESIKEMSDIVELARSAGRLSSIHEFNQYIVNITEDLMTEIEQRRRILRRIKKAIAFELEYV